MHRMFQVIVVGGISLTGYACGRDVVIEGGRGVGGAAFGPSVTTGPLDETAPVSATTGGFPSISGAGGASGLGGMGGAGGASGLGGMGGAGGASPSDAGCFPQETALPCPPPEAGPGGEAGAAPDASFPMEAPPPPPLPRP